MALSVFARNENTKRKTLEQQVTKLNEQFIALQREIEAVKQENLNLKQKLTQALMEKQRTQLLVRKQKQKPRQNAKPIVQEEQQIAPTPS